MKLIILLLALSLMPDARVNADATNDAVNRVLEMLAKQAATIIPLVKAQIGASSIQN